MVLHFKKYSIQLSEQANEFDFMYKSLPMDTSFSCLVA